MHMSSRTVALLAASLALSACNTAATNRPAVSTPSTQPASAADRGTVPDYCPEVTLREGTGVIRQGGPDSLRYVATIADVSRSCRVLDGQLFIEVAVAGRLVTGNAAPGGMVSLPIRVAVLDGQRLVYSQLGQQPVSGERSPDPQDFRYVDRGIRLPVPEGRTLTVFVGYDEGPGAGGAARS